MSLSERFIRFFGKTKGIDYWEEPGYVSDSVGNIEIPIKLTEENAFKLSNTVAEIYFPIDFYADRGSKLRHYIADAQGNEVENSPYNRFLTEINPLYSLSDIYYQYIFSYMGDGNAITLVNVPSIYKKPSANSITRLDVLDPDRISIDEYTNITPLNVTSINELIRRARYFNDGRSTDLEINKLRIDRIDQTRRAYSLVLSRPPLFKCQRNINNLLATYSARYNVYVNNGAAGYLVKKSGGSNSLESIVDPVTRQQILNDINERNGITGRKNFWGISSVPLEFINTLAHIKDLMPFDETLENSIKIGAVWQMHAGLIPRKDQSTYNNQAADEKAVWENGLMSMVQTVDENLTRALYLDKVGYQLKSDFSSVSVLNVNKSEHEDLTAKQIQNLKSLKDMMPENTEIDKQLELIVQSYGKA